MADICRKFANCIVFRFYGRFIKVLSITETVDKIVNESVSISRFGDGEFNLIFGTGIGFQEQNTQLSQKLLTVLHSQDENHLICVSNFFTKKKMMLRTDENRTWWRRYFTGNAIKWFRHLNLQYVYGNASISRFYIPFQDKETSRQNAEYIKRIWMNRNVLVIEGEKTRLGVGNDLLNGAKEVKRILCPSRDAFSKYDEILNEVRRHSKDYLVLIALGPTATVLAYDLAKEGYQALDIGHIDLEYEWMKMGAIKPVALKNKYVNEAAGGTDVTDVVDAQYQSEIISHICL